jgi:hypothetical protein
MWCIGIMHATIDTYNSPLSFILIYFLRVNLKRCQYTYFWQTVIYFWCGKKERKDSERVFFYQCLPKISILTSFQINPQLNHSISLGFNLHLHYNLFLSQTLVHNICMLKITYIKLLILTITSRYYYLKEHTRKGLSKKKKKHVLCYSGFLWLGRCHTSFL